MNSVKITYIIATAIMELVFFLGMLLTPTYLTPGYYWWSFICFILLVATGAGFAQRVNGWKDMGHVE